MTDVTEQFAEIMNMTIQEAADADERTHAAEVQLAAAVAAQDDFARLTAARTAIMTASMCDAEEELAQAEEDSEAWEDCAFNRKEEIDQLKAENDQLSTLLERAQRSHVDQRKEIKELADRMEELLMENMRLTVQAEAAEEELAELKDSEADSS